MEKVRLPAKGRESPAFVNYENHRGGATSLSDLKGKFVYIDIWATWCGSCKAEIPHLKELEKKYRQRNIAFVSISVDEKGTTEEWRKMVNDEGLSGIQLIADEDWTSDFMRNYQINSIPHFILLDTEGRIISARAPRPSNREILEALFYENGI